MSAPNDHVSEIILGLLNIFYTYIIPSVEHETGLCLGSGPRNGFLHSSGCQNLVLNLTNDINIPTKLLQSYDTKKYTFRQTFLEKLRQVY